jgi:flagellin
LSKRSLLVVLAAIAVSHGTAAATSIIMNGGFETGDLTGWSLSGSSSEMRFDFVNSRANTGNYGLYLGAGALVTVSQTLATMAGQQYTLDYWLFNQGGTPNYFAADWNGSVVPGSALTNTGAQPFTEYTYTVDATSSSTVVGFSSYQAPNSWSIDDITVTEATPEPGSFVMVAGSLSLLWFRRRRG